MNILRPAPVSTERLTYVPSECLIVSEASDLPEPGRVYDDACDLGYTLISHRTGREIVFVQTGTEKREGEIVWWDYAPLTPSGKVGVFSFSLRVYND